MKKTPSTHSLLNQRRGSLQKLQPQPKQTKDKQKPSQKQRIPSPIVKNIKVQPLKQQGLFKVQHQKNDIKQIYEYKIKQRAKKSVQLQRSKQPFNSHQQQQVAKLEDERFFESLKMQNEKMSRQLYELAKENKRLKQLLITSKDQTGKTKKDNLINQKIEKPAAHDKTTIDKDYKRQMLAKLDDRQRIKTEMTSSFHNKLINAPSTNNIGGKLKSSGSRSKLLSSSRNSITMNVNMSFVKLKSPSTGKHGQLRESSKETLAKIVKSTSRRDISHKQQGSTKHMSKHHEHQEKKSIESLFKQFSDKKSVTQSDLQSFYQLSRRIFGEFNHFVSLSKKVYTEMLHKINYAQCYDSKKMQSSVNDKTDTLINNTLVRIQDLYRVNCGRNNERNNVFYSSSQQDTDKKYNVSEIEPTQQTPSSSVVSFTEVTHNPERQKSYQKYRLDKLNKNLQLIDNVESKKLRSEATEPETNQPKVYFSKPISSNVSRKISFNNSYNNSLKNSKIE